MGLYLQHGYHCAYEQYFHRVEITNNDRLHDHRRWPASSSLHMVGVFTEIVVRSDVFRDDML